MPTDDYWRRRYERAEAERVRLAGELAQRVDTAADEQQEQIDALEQMVLNRATLIGITLDGRKVRFTFVRKAQVYRCEAYAAMDMQIDKWRKELLDD